MKQIGIEKVTLNCGCGTDHTRLEKSVKLLQNITKRKPVRTKTQLRVAGWGLRKGLPIGTKVTLRGSDAQKILVRLLDAKDNQLKESTFDDNGNVAFGIAECIDIPGVEYDPDIGIIGLQCTITLTRPGFRIKRRILQKRRVPKHHAISKKEAVNFMTANFKIKIDTGEEEE